MNKRISIITVLVVLPLLILSGCIVPSDPPAYLYRGDHVDLNCVATNNILGIFAVDNNNIVVVDEDFYGRRLFIYWGNSNAASYQLRYDKPPAIYGILISQKTDGDTVYFYPDYNFVIYKDNRETRSWPKNEYLLEYAYDAAIADDIEWLKNQNDWEKPIDESKCVSVKVSRKNRAAESKTPLVPDEALEKAYKQVAASDDIYSWGLFNYLTSDQYDRHICFFRCIREDDVYTKSYVVMFNKDGSFDQSHGIMEIADVWHYQDQLKAFKEKNGWNTSVN
jgi:signal peptidase I